MLARNVHIAAERRSPICCFSFYCSVTVWGRDKKCKCNCSRETSGLLPWHTELHSVTELCKVQNWLERNTNLTAGKTTPIHVFHLLILLFLEFSFNFCFVSGLGSSKYLIEFCRSIQREKNIAHSSALIKIGIKCMRLQAQSFI